MLSRPLIAIGCLAAALLSGPSAAAAGGPSAAGAGTGTGDPISVIPVADHDRAAVAKILADVPFAGARTTYGVRAYRIEYRTVSAHGRPTTASALVALPDGRRGPADTVVWEHGTRVGRADVASVSDTDNLDRPVALLFATAGFLTVAPDYLPSRSDYGP